MSYATAEVLGRVERRRRFSVEQKLAVPAEAMAPGANISAVARRHGLLRSWSPALRCSGHRETDRSWYPCGDGRLAIGGMRMPDAGLELELARISHTGL